MIIMKDGYYSSLIIIKSVIYHYCHALCNAISKLISRGQINHFIRMSGMNLTLDTICIPWLVRSNFCVNEIIYKFRKRSLMGFQYYLICAEI